MSGGASLQGRTVEIPGMCRGTAHTFAGAFRSFGIDAKGSPDGDDATRELALKHLGGDECYPQIITLGNFLKSATAPGFDPSRSAVFMPSSPGPCRFGQYSRVFKRTLEKMGYGEVLILSPSCENGYRGLGDNGPELFRYCWWAVVAADLLRKMLHRYRPYELVPGMTDKVYWKCIEDAADTLAQQDRRGPKKFADLVMCMGRCRERFRKIKADLTQKKLLIGVAGEIFCRLNTYSNDDLVRKIEAHGGEGWMADITEWVYYVNLWEMEELRTFEGSFNTRMLKAKLSDAVQRKEEHSLARVFEEDLRGREEPHSVWEIVKAGEKYIPAHAALGEMILSVGKASWYQKKNCAGMVDISPFTCMNGIVAEALYPKVIEDLGGMPIRTFYFDGTRADTDGDVSIFMELAKRYDKKRGI
jgi:predicted nucleotide-binding protein (sugar kinase/HSP70/actin superfamily)